ncbi:MAG TPA: choice-of-anchor tandem repeat GloVer-containing protein [Terriglobales bacterium]|nr:choice-of-anchor tandem repeat GloVer-containing protein [Terriglobales bacterium]
MKSSKIHFPFRGVAAYIIIFVLCVAAVPSTAQTYTTLVTFDVTNGANPYFGPLVQGRDGNLYGTTEGGGANSAGTVFKMTLDGTLTPLYSFCAQLNCADGEDPVAGLVLGTDGNFYGTTLSGGGFGNCSSTGCGTIFKISPTGNLSTIHSFGSLPGDGFQPVAGLVQGNNGSFYGTTGEGFDGTFFRISSSGTFKELHDFYPPEGIFPWTGPTLGSDGSFYGTTVGGGTSSACNDGCGTVYKIKPTGKLTTLHSFGLADGASPYSGTVQASDGNFYGTTTLGGINPNSCTFVVASEACGTIFQITATGQLTSLYYFCSVGICLDGLDAFGTLIQATDGNLYGTTVQGGLFTLGVLFQVTTSGSFQVLHNFDRDNGGNPSAGLVQATNGKLYGTTFYGGSSQNCPYGCGSIYSLDLGLSPFVEALTYSGKVGKTIEFLGQGFTKSSTVAFNGVTAKASIKSGTYLTAKVPVGATTGYVTITTANGTLTSNKEFNVVP